MKKWRIGAALVLSVVALAGSTIASAAGYGGGRCWNAGAAGEAIAASSSWTGARWQDADGDGICDSRAGCWADADDDGICDLCGRTGRGYSYVDADGNGLCDNYGTSGGHHGGRHCRW